MSLIATHCIHRVSVDEACVLCDSPPWDEPGCAPVKRAAVSCPHRFIGKDIGAACPTALEVASMRPTS